MLNGEQAEQDQLPVTAVKRSVVVVPVSMDFGTIKFPTKPTAYKKAARKVRYEIIPKRKVTIFFMLLV